VNFVVIASAKFSFYLRIFVNIVVNQSRSGGLQSCVHACMHACVMVFTAVFVTVVLTTVCDDCDGLAYVVISDICPYYYYFINTGQSLFCYFLFKHNLSWLTHMIHYGTTICNNHGHMVNKY